MGKIFEYIQQPLWNNWYVGEKIGQGKYSEVYKIYSCDKVSALKVKPVFADNPESLERKLVVAIREAEIMNILKECPYIVEYQDRTIQKISDLQYLVMIRTEILAPLDRIFFSENIIRKIALDIGKALEYTHSAGIVHCDVKQDNFFVSQDGKYKLGDFNISGYSRNKRYPSGTSGYIAPEVYRNSVYDSRSDIYSFGKSLSSLMNYISPEFSEIISKACADDVCDRYQTIIEMLTDISALERNYYINPEDFFS